METRFSQLSQDLAVSEKQLQQAGIILKSRQDVEEIKSHTTLLRERIVQQGEKEDREVTRAQKQHDTETYALTAQNVAEINGLVKLLTSKTEHGQRLREMLMEFEHESQMTDKTLKAKSEQTEPTNA
jgi:transposase